MSVEPHIGQTTAVSQNTLTRPDYVIDIISVEFTIEEPVTTLMPADRLAFTFCVNNHRANTPAFRDDILHTSRTHTGVYLLSLLGIAAVAKERTSRRASIANGATHDDAVFLAKFIVAVCCFHDIVLRGCLSSISYYRQPSSKKSRKNKKNIRHRIC